MRLVHIDIRENPHLDQVSQLRPQERNTESPSNSKSSGALNPSEAQAGTIGATLRTTTPQENIIPIPVPPPRCPIAVDTAAADANAEVQDAILQALMRIRATASTETGGLFEDDLQDTEITLGFTNHLREGQFAPEDA